MQAFHIFNTVCRSLITGRATEFAVGNQKFSIHDRLATANSPYIADLLKEAKKANITGISIPTEPRLFAYFHAWLYDKDGTFLYKAHDFYLEESALGFPYNPLVKLYLLAYVLRNPSFANAVLKKIVQVRQETDQVGDVSTIELIYKEGQQGQKIHTLFVDLAAWYVHEANVVECENLQFLRAVAYRLVQIRQDLLKKPVPKDYFITEIAGPEREVLQENDDDDCVIISSQPAANAGRASRAQTVKRERSTADVEA